MLQKVILENRSSALPVGLMPLIDEDEARTTSGSTQLIADIGVVPSGLTSPRAVLVPRVVYAQIADNPEPETPGSGASHSMQAMPDAVMANWNALSTSGLSAEFFGRLLAISVRRENSVGPPVSADALAGFLKFWKRISPNRGEPELAISPGGDVQVEWYKNDKNNLVMEFRGDKSIFFSHWEGGLPIEGIGRVSRIDELAKMFTVRRRNPLLWSS